MIRLVSPVRHSLARALVAVLLAGVVTHPLSAQAGKAGETNRQTPAVQKPAPRPTGGATQSGGIIDINRATPAELEAIPGIGKAYAAKIIAGRPYTTKAGLVQKNILSAALYEKIKDRIIAKQ